MNDKQLKELLSPEWVEQLEKTKKDYLKLVFSNEGSLALEASKVGGIGYLPLDQGYPRNLVTGSPLFLLAQLNFSELPALVDYPSKGILAFYVDYTDDLIGLDFDSPMNQRGFRVLFFEEPSVPSYTREQQLAIQAEVTEELYKVVEGELKIRAKVQSHYACTDCYEFSQHFGKTMYEWLDDVTDDVEKQDKINYVLFDLAMGSRVGGYPFFAQQDPRFYPDSPYDTLLFQLDSEKVDNKWSIMWGDMGVGNFFISREGLRKKDFTDIQYNWDCT